MSISYQQLANFVKKNSDIKFSLEKIKKHLPTLHYKIPNKKNPAEKFACLFLQEIQKKSQQNFKKEPLLQKKIWQFLYNNLHTLGKKNKLEGISFFAQYFADLKKDQKNISKFCPTTRSYILYNLWYSKQKDFDYFKENYCFLQKQFTNGNYQFKKMKPIFLYKRQSQKESYFFHHGLASINPHSFQKLILSYIKGKRVIPDLLEEKEFLYFCRATDNYLPSLAKGVFVNLAPLLQEVATKYFPQQSRLPAICWSGQFSYRKLAAYSFLEDKIFVSEIFDVPQKNTEILSFLIFHELLHRDLGVQKKGIKIYAHTKEFKKQEKNYPNFSQIKKRIENYLAMKEI